MTRRVKKLMTTIIISIMTFSVVLLLLYTRYLTMLNDQQKDKIEDITRASELEQVQASSDNLTHIIQSDSLQCAVDSLQEVIDSLQRREKRKK